MSKTETAVLKAGRAMLKTWRDNFKSEKAVLKRK